MPRMSLAELPLKNWLKQNSAILANGVADSKRTSAPSDCRGASGASGAMEPGYWLTIQPAAT